MTLKDAAKDVYGLLKGTFKHWSDSNTSEMGAALAYYAVFAISPLLLIAIAVATWVLGAQARQTTQQRVHEELTSTAGKPVADAVMGLVTSNQGLGSGALATALAVVVLLFGALGVFSQLQTSLNTLWGVKPRPGRGVWGLVAGYFLSFVMVVVTAILLLASLVVSTGLHVLGGAIIPTSGAAAVLWQVIDALVSFAVVTALFALIYKVLPDVTIGWHDVWVGAAVTAALFTAGKYLLGLYLARGSVTSGYGAAGSLVLILLWVYYSSQILLFGAALTSVYANRYGSHVRPSANAVPLTADDVARQGRPQAQPINRHQPA